jgi:hypothetical protein
MKKPISQILSENGFTDFEGLQKAIGESLAEGDHSIAFEFVKERLNDVDDEVLEQIEEGFKESIVEKKSKKKDDEEDDDDNEDDDDDDDNEDDDDETETDKVKGKKKAKAECAKSKKSVKEDFDGSVDEEMESLLEELNDLDIDDLDDDDITEGKVEEIKDYLDSVPDDIEYNIQEIGGSIIVKIENNDTQDAFTLNYDTNGNFSEFMGKLAKCCGDKEGGKMGEIKEDMEIEEMIDSLCEEYDMEEKDNEDYDILEDIDDIDIEDDEDEIMEDTIDNIIENYDDILEELENDIEDAEYDETVEDDEVMEDTIDNIIENYDEILEELENDIEDDEVMEDMLTDIIDNYDEILEAVSDAPDGGEGTEVTVSDKYYELFKSSLAKRKSLLGASEAIDLFEKTFGVLLSMDGKNELATKLKADEMLNLNAPKAKRELGVADKKVIARVEKVLGFDMEKYIKALVEEKAKGNKTFEEISSVIESEVKPFVTMNDFAVVMESLKNECQENGFDVTTKNSSDNSKILDVLENITAKVIDIEKTIAEKKEEDKTNDNEKQFKNGVINIIKKHTKGLNDTDKRRIEVLMESLKFDSLNEYDKACGEITKGIIINRKDDKVVTESADDKLVYSEIERKYKKG